MVGGIFTVSRPAYRPVPVPEYHTYNNNMHTTLFIMDRCKCIRITCCCCASGPLVPPGALESQDLEKSRCYEIKACRLVDCTFRVYQESSVARSRWPRGSLHSCSCAVSEASNHECICHQSTACCTVRCQSTLTLVYSNRA